VLSGHWHCTPSRDEQNSTHSAGAISGDYIESAPHRRPTARSMGAGPVVRVNHDPTRARYILACAQYSASVSPGLPAVWDSRPPKWCALRTRRWGLACCAVGALSWSS